MGTRRRLIQILISPLLSALFERRQGLKLISMKYGYRNLCHRRLILPRAVNDLIRVFIFSFPGRIPFEVELVRSWLKVSGFCTCFAEAHFLGNILLSNLSSKWHLLIVKRGRYQSVAQRQEMASGSLARPIYIAVAGHYVGQ